MNLNELPDMSDALKQVQEKSGCGGYSKGGPVKGYSKGGKLDPVGKEDSFYLATLSSWTYWR